jgi:hypothetical protein
VAIVPLPHGSAPKALVLSVAPAGGPLGLEAWLDAPGRPPLKLGAVAPYPAGQAGEYLLGWPASLGALPPPVRAQVRLVLTPGAPDAQATVTATWRR